MIIFKKIRQANDMIRKTNSSSKRRKKSRTRKQSEVIDYLVKEAKRLKLFHLIEPWFTKQ